METLDLSSREKERLRKLLAVARSDRDHEALAAVRKAEAIMHRHGLSLDALIDRLDAAQTALQGTNARLRKLEMQLELERAQARDISALLDDKEGRRAPTMPPRLHPTLLDVCHHMIRHCNLNPYERRLLERIEEVRPRSKEAHLVMICAGRYGVDLDAEPVPA